jgi:hypothetical protein
MALQMRFKWIQSTAELTLLQQKSFDIISVDGKMLYDEQKIG